MHSMQAGYMDKAQKYTDKALAQIEKLKILDGHPILYTFQLMLLEHIIMCRLVVGEKSMAVQEVSHKRESLDFFFLPTLFSFLRTCLLAQDY